MPLSAGIGAGCGNSGEGLHPRLSPFSTCALPRPFAGEGWGEQPPWIGNSVAAPCDHAGGSPAASHFLCFAKESNQRKASAGKLPFGFASKYAVKREMKKTRLRLRQFSFLIRFTAHFDASFQAQSSGAIIFRVAISTAMLHSIVVAVGSQVIQYKFLIYMVIF